MKKTIIASFLVIVMSVFAFAPAFASKAKAYDTEPTEYCDYAVYILFNTNPIRPDREQAYIDAVTWAYNFVQVWGCSI